MDEKDDLQWLDALAGRSRGEQNPEGQVLRSAILQREAAAPRATDVPDEDAGREADLIARARREGLLVDATQLEGNPFARRSTLRSVLRTAGSRGWAAAALAVAVLALAWHMRPATSPEEIYRGAADGAVHLTASDPRALKQQLVTELRAAGVQATGYEQLGISGIDADLPQPVPDAARRVLERHGMPVPEDGVLRIEIAASEGN